MDTNNDTQKVQTSTNGMDKNKPLAKIEVENLTLKGFILIVMSFLLLLPLLMIESLSSERQSRLTNIRDEVAESWGDDKFLSITKLIIVNEFGSTNPTLVKKADIMVDLDYQERPKGDFIIPVYKAYVDFNLSFDLTDLHPSFKLSRYNLSQYKELKINDKDVKNASCIGHERCSIELDEKSTNFVVSGKIELLGANDFSISMPPVKNNTIFIRSNAINPAFEEVLPDEYEIDENGFWAKYYGVALESKNAKITFVQEDVNGYKFIERSVKYGIMFIGLTFLVVFLCELQSKNKILLLQYIIIGVSIVLFYLMLLSFSEHLGFDLGYFISSLAVILPLFFYTYAIIDKKKFASIIALFLCALYLCFYILLKQGEYALLLGTFALMFGIYALMYFTKNLNKEA